MRFYIKYMVSDRCKMLLKTELDKMGIHNVRIDLGVVEIEDTITTTMWQQLKNVLLESGLELMEDKKSVQILQIKSTINEMIHTLQNFEANIIIDQVCQTTNCNFSYLAQLFAEMEGQTLKKYIADRKIDFAKQLLLKEQLNITEISYRLSYSSVAHFSNQFKKLTGSSPSKFKTLHLQEK